MKKNEIKIVTTIGTTFFTIGAPCRSICYYFPSIRATVAAMAGKVAPPEGTTRFFAWAMGLAKDLWIAARPLSLSLALYSTSIGCIIAFRERKAFRTGDWKEIVLFALITVAGLSVQMATNFINDFFECGQKHREPRGRVMRFLGKDRGAFDILVFLLGMACFGLTAIVGLVLMAISTVDLFWIGLVGLVGGYAYTGEPFVYKRFGLGAILSFLLMGPLMTFGSYFAAAREASLLPIGIALPQSLLIPLLMMSNEIRDHDRDASLGIRTLTVLVGRPTGKVVFIGLLVLAFSLPLCYALAGLVPLACLAVFASAPMAFKAWKEVDKPRNNGVPATNAFQLLYGFLYMGALLLFP